MASALLSLALTAVLALPGAVTTPPSGATPAHGTWPLVPTPAVVHAFSPPDRPWGSGHRGVDLRGEVGQQVRAALGGTVAFAGRIAGRGVVVVDHGEVRTTYEPVGASVAVGDDVSAGARLGELEWFGSHCLPQACLHWGLIEGDTYLDPLSLVGAGPRPVRLLPVDAGEPGPPVRPMSPGAARCLPPHMGRPGQARGWACW